MQAEGRPKDCLFPGVLLTLLSWGDENFQKKIQGRRGQGERKKIRGSCVLKATKGKRFGGGHLLQMVLMGSVRRGLGTIDVEQNVVEGGGHSPMAMNLRENWRTGLGVS